MMATRWAVEEDWMIKRKQQTSPRDKYEFITCILNKMKLPTKHGKTEKQDGEKRFKKKTPRSLGPGDTMVHTRADRQCNCVGTGMWLAKGSMENLPKEQSTKIPLGKYKESCTNGGREEQPPRQFLETRLQRT